MTVGSFESGTFDRHPGDRTALLDDDGIEIGTLTLTRDSFVDAAFDPHTGALHVGIAANTAPPPVVLVDEDDHAQVLSHGGWVWTFSFGETAGGETGP